MKLHDRHKCYWSVLIHDDWRLFLAASEAGLRFVDGPDEPEGEALDRLARMDPDAEPVRDDAALAPYAAQLSEYLRGARDVLTFPTDVGGTPFQAAVWEALREVEYGETVSYAELARRIGRPTAARAVGAAVGANPLLIAIPCHRAVGSDGSLTGYRGGLAMKRRLLELERRSRLSPATVG